MGGTSQRDGMGHPPSDDQRFLNTKKSSTKPSIRLNRQDRFSLESRPTSVVFEILHEILSNLDIRDTEAHVPDTRDVTHEEKDDDEDMLIAAMLDAQCPGFRSHQGDKSECLRSKEDKKPSESAQHSSDLNQMEFQVNNIGEFKQNTQYHSPFIRGSASSKSTLMTQSRSSSRAPSEPRHLPVDRGASLQSDPMDLVDEKEEKDPPRFFRDAKIRAAASSPRLASSDLQFTKNMGNGPISSPKPDQDEMEIESGMKNGKILGAGLVKPLSSPGTDTPRQMASVFCQDKARIQIQASRSSSSRTQASLSDGPQESFAGNEKILDQCDAKTKQITVPDMIPVGPLDMEVMPSTEVLIEKNVNKNVCEITISRTQEAGQKVRPSTPGHVDIVVPSSGSKPNLDPSVPFQELLKINQSRQNPQGIQSLPRAISTFKLPGKAIPVYPHEDPCLLLQYWPVLPKVNNSYEDNAEVQMKVIRSAFEQTSYSEIAVSNRKESSASQNAGVRNEHQPVIDEGRRKEIEELALGSKVLINRQASARVLQGTLKPPYGSAHSRGPLAVGKESQFVLNALYSLNENGGSRNGSKLTVQELQHAIDTAKRNTSRGDPVVLTSEDLPSGMKRSRVAREMGPPPPRAPNTPRKKLTIHRTLPKNYSQPRPQRPNFAAQSTLEWNKGLRAQILPTTNPQIMTMQHATVAPQVQFSSGNTSREMQSQASPVPGIAGIGESALQFMNMQHAVMSSQAQNPQERLSDAAPQQANHAPGNRGMAQSAPTVSQQFQQRAAPVSTHHQTNAAPPPSAQPAVTSTQRTASVSRPFAANAPASASTPSQSQLDDPLSQMMRAEIAQTPSGQTGIGQGPTNHPSRGQSVFFPFLVHPTHISQTVNGPVINVVNANGTTSTLPISALQLQNIPNSVPPEPAVPIHNAPTSTAPIATAPVQVGTSSNDLPPSNNPRPANSSYEVVRKADGPSPKGSKSKQVKKTQGSQTKPKRKYTKRATASGSTPRGRKKGGSSRPNGQMTNVPKPMPNRMKTGQPTPARTMPTPTRSAPPSYSPDYQASTQMRQNTTVPPAPANFVNAACNRAIQTSSAYAAGQDHEMYPAHPRNTIGMLGSQRRLSSQGAASSTRPAEVPPVIPMKQPICRSSRHMTSIGQGMPTPAEMAALMDPSAPQSEALPYHRMGPCSSATPANSAQFNQLPRENPPTAMGNASLPIEKRQEVDQLITVTNQFRSQAPLSQTPYVPSFQMERRGPMSQSFPQCAPNQVGAQHSAARQSYPHNNPTRPVVQQPTEIPAPSITHRPVPVIGNEGQYADSSAVSRTFDFDEPWMFTREDQQSLHQIDMLALDSEPGFSFQDAFQSELSVTLPSDQGVSPEMFETPRGVSERKNMFSTTRSKGGEVERPSMGSFTPEETVPSFEDLI